MTVYDLVCRSDTNDTPNLSWSRGLTQQGDSESASSTVLTVGSHPYQSKAFREKWRVEKTTQLTMKPGETHKHYIDVTLNRTVTNTRVNATGSEAPKYSIAGVTRCVMVVCEGTLASSDAGLPTTTATRLGVMWQRQYRYAANIRANRYTYGTTALPQPTDLKIVQEDRDILAPGTA